MKTSYESVKEWRYNTKLRLIDAFGGSCGICDYKKCKDSLEFHHINPEEKDFNFSSVCKSWANVVNEAKKCAMLCANCHREVHAGVTILPNNIPKFDDSYIDYKTGKYFDDCPMCGKLKPKSQITCSRTCGSNRRNILDWSKYDLLKLYDDIGSYLGVARHIGNVSSVTIKKRIVKLKKDKG